MLDLGHECRAIGDRSFGCDVKSAVNLAAAFIDGMSPGGHGNNRKNTSPGHGHVLADSHLVNPL